MNRYGFTKLYVSLILAPLLAHAGSKALCRSDIAAGYALAIANQQFSQQTFAQKPFKVQTINEVTAYHFKELGMTDKQMTESQKKDPVEVHYVVLRAKNNWECNYYVTLSTSSSRYCDFSTIHFQFCSQ